MERRRRPVQPIATSDLVPSTSAAPNELMTWGRGFLRFGKKRKEEPERQSDYDIETRKGVSPETLSQLPLEVLEKLSMEVLAGAPDAVSVPPSSCLSRVNPDKLLKLENEKFYDVLRTDPSLLSFYSSHDLRSRLSTDALLALPPQALCHWLKRDLLYELTQLDDERARGLNDILSGRVAPAATHLRANNGSLGESAEPSLSLALHTDIPPQPSQAHLGRPTSLEMALKTHQASSSRNPASSSFRGQRQSAPPNQDNGLEEIEGLRAKLLQLEIERSVSTEKVAAMLNKQYPRRVLGPDDNAVDVLLESVSKMGALNVELAAVREELKSCQRLSDLQSNEIGQLRKKNASLSRDLRLKENEMKKRTHEFEEMIRTMESDHKTSIDNQRAVYEHRLQEQRDRINEMEDAHQKELQIQEKRHQKVIGVKAEDRQQEVVDLRHRIMSLERDLVDNSDDFRPATDDALKARFCQLKLAIEIITTPHNLGVRAILQNERLDPTGFLQRDRAALCYLLRSLVWGKIITGFFSSPFGFGVLGSGSGKAALTHLYCAWMKIFETRSRPGEQPRVESHVQAHANTVRHR